MRTGDNLASMLNRRVEVWGNAAAGKDELGQQIKSPSKVSDLWAEVKPQTGTILRGRAAISEISKTTHLVTVRYRKDLSEDMWLVIQGEKYDILYILDPYLSHERLELFCEVSTNG